MIKKGLCPGYCCVTDYIQNRSFVFNFAELRQALDLWGMFGRIGGAHLQAVEHPSPITTRSKIAQVMHTILPHSRNSRTKLQRCGRRNASVANATD